jgi:H+/Cl- antiporter ClcA
MSPLWIIVFCLVALVWVLSVVDIVRQRYPGWTTAGLLALVLVLPIVGSVIYWFGRKPRREGAEQVEEAEQQYLAEADRRRTAAARPFDSTGMGP